MGIGVHDFKVSDEWSNFRCKKFQEVFPKKLIQTGGMNKEDFIIESSRNRIELKSEKYFSGRNLFIERHSNMEFKTDGGPWRARKHGIEYYIHFFLDDVYLVYDPVEIVPFLEKFIVDYNPKGTSIFNKGWETWGYALSIKLLRPFELQFNTKNS